MSAYYIGVHLETDDAALVRRELAALFTGEGYRLLSDEPAPSVVEDEDRLPAGEDWYGVMVSGAAGERWVSVYVADWQDSGALATGLSRRLAVPALEIWVSEDVHWGYTYYEAGVVRDRFAADPATVAEAPAEREQYAGQAQVLAPILQVPVAEMDQRLRHACRNAGRFAGESVDALAQAVGLPFGHAFTGYDYFFEDDPEDYAADLTDWAGFRHLAFQPPPGRETLAA